MTLGKQLKNTMAVMETARIDGLERKAAADMAKLLKEQQAYQLCVNEYWDAIVSKIGAAGVPLIKETNYSQMEWLRKAQSGKAAHQHIWNKFIEDLGNNGLLIVLNEAHDGCGMKNWINLSVKPI